MHFTFTAATLSVLAPIALAAPASSLLERQDCQFDPATTPNCWGKYSLDTNYYDDGPDTGVEVPVYLELKNITLSADKAPDGVARTVLAVNGTIPGPTIKGNWGDTFVVTVKNSISDAGTSIHFHGLRQLNNNQNDGVVSITQCPTPGEGDTITYRFKATQYGTSWYHSHYAVQAWDGLFGPIVINGPASEKYNEDFGPLMLSDWTHQTAESLVPEANANDGYPMNNGLINGKNTYKGTGERYQIVFKKGTRYRLRLINTSMDTHYKVALDKHTMRVIANDFVPIKPFDTEILSIGIGQRYDVIIEANQDGGDFWFRANAQGNCGQHEEGFDVNAIVRYDATSKADPQTTGPTFDFDCDDMDPTKLVPSLKVSAAKADFDHPIEFQQQYNETIPAFHWEIKNIPYNSPWDYPTLQQVVQGNTSYDSRQQIVPLETGNDKKWVWVLVTTSAGTAHPIHLHGHDFFILDQGNTPYDPTKPPTKFDDLPRRDVAMLPLGGYVLLAFQTDNPGAWLMHCHIGWHTSQGFALTFLENKDKAKTQIDAARLNNNCDNWKKFATKHGIVQHDSGV